jgi:mannose-1-phosphate guanylyltransferase|tara:strand:- start:458 stop:1153 length:696 start_codon:yes stop_codon:yes gene_type:complete
MKAVILAGGLGTRLLPYTKTLPKPMLLLGKKPILEYVIKWIKKNGIRDIVLCVSYKRKKIESYFQDGKKFGVNIEYAISRKPLSTAGQLKTAEKFIDDTFVCTYGDTISDFNLKRMIKEHERKKVLATMSLYNYKYTLRYGVINTKKHGLISSWNEKPMFNAKINMGSYIFEPEIFSFIPKNKQYGMDDAIKKAIIKKKRINSFISKNEFIDVGTKEIYEKMNLIYSKKEK